MFSCAESQITFMLVVWEQRDAFPQQGIVGSEQESHYESLW